MGKGYESDKRRREARVPAGTSGLPASAGIPDKEIAESITALALTCLFAVLLLGVYNLAAWLFHLFSYLNDKIPDKVLLGQLTAMGTLFGGIALFVLRERRRAIYATLEIAFAVVTSGIAASKVRTQGDLSVWIAIAASCYLVVRGVENLQKSGITVSESWNRFLASLIVRKRIQ